jgi:hypothetical protein
LFQHHDGAVIDKIDETGQNLEIDLNELVDTGLPHLEYHLPAIGQPRRMDLPDRSTPERLRIEEGEDLIGRGISTFTVILPR